MSRPNPIRQIMEAPLPSLTYQRRLQFRPTDEDVKYAYKIINQYVFDNQLRRPEIRLGICRDYWGQCEAIDDYKSIIKLSDKWYCGQWFLATLAHEMAHQYQWDVDSKEREDMGLDGIMSHGPSFFMWRERMEHYGIVLKKAYARRRWFMHQDFHKC